MRWWCLLHGQERLNSRCYEFQRKKSLTLNFVNIKYQPCGCSQHLSELLKHVLEAIPQELVLSPGVI